MYRCITTNHVYGVVCLSLVLALIVKGVLVQGQSGTGTCSTVDSRTIRNVLEEEVYPVVEYEGWKWPAECPLNPENDQLRDLEGHKKKKRRNRWKCEVCGKKFKEEHYLDQHLETQHADLLSNSMKGGSMCLAHLCDIIAPCSNTYSVCSESVMERRKYKCQSIMATCFPSTNGPQASVLHDLFSRRFCDILTCNKEAINRLDHVIMEHSTKWSKWRIFWYVMAFLAVFFLGLFYFTYWLYRSEFTTKSDLRKRRRESRLKSLWSKQKEG